MRKSSTALLAATAFVLIASAVAVPQVRAQDAPPPVPTRALEDAVETSTESVLLPTSVPGTITFRDCAAPCKLPSLNVTTESKFFVGRTQVALADFNAFLRTGGSRPITVLRKVNGTDVTRVVVIGDFEPLGQTKPARQTKRPQ